MIQGLNISHPRRGFLHKSYHQKPAPASPKVQLYNIRFIIKKDPLKNHHPAAISNPLTAFLKTIIIKNQKSPKNHPHQNTNPLTKPPKIVKAEFSPTHHTPNLSPGTDFYNQEQVLIPLRQFPNQFPTKKNRTHKNHTPTPPSAIRT